MRAAFAVQDCELNGQSVNPDNGNTTAGRVFRDETYDDSGRIMREKALDGDGKLLRDDAVFEDGSRKAFAR
jgi:hypothetical protein